MKNVVILSGSARLKGNTSKLCVQFAKGAEEAGHQVTRFDVARMNVPGCLGCGACQRNGGTCIQKDDMAQIREAMLAADAIVLASPVYYYTICAQLKAVIDRTYAFFRDLSGKTFYYVLASAAPDMSYDQTAVAALQGFTCCVPDAVEGGTVVGLGCSEKDDVLTNAAYEQAYQMGLAC